MKTEKETTEGQGWGFGGVGKVQSGEGLVKSKDFSGNSLKNMS